jgi:hypothetical protein
MDGLVDILMNGQMDEWTGGCMNRWMNGQVDEWTDARNE